MFEQRKLPTFVVLLASTLLGSVAAYAADPPLAPPAGLPVTTTKTETTTTTTTVTKPGTYPATKREEAAAAAKQVAGRADPFEGTFERTPYPAPWTKYVTAGGRTTIDDANEEKEKADKEHGIAKGGDVVPPPPPPSKEKPVPPPPPIAEAPTLPIDTLPLPPDKPLVTPSLRLTAIVGNKAVLAVPLQLRTQNKWPAVICLGPGEKFEDPANGSFSVVSVDPDSVTIEEESERSVKSLPQIK